MPVIPRPATTAKDRPQNGLLLRITDNGFRQGRRVLFKPVADGLDILVSNAATGGFAPIRDIGTLVPLPGGRLPLAEGDSSAESSQRCARRITSPPCAVASRGCICVGRAWPTQMLEDVMRGEEGCDDSTG